MHAESIYLFRHALLRDAAYQLQLPGDRARLHGIAFDVIERISGRPPELSPLRDPEPLPFHPHPSDAFAEELAAHAATATTPDARRSRTLYLRRAAEDAERRFRHHDAARLWLEHAGLVDAPDRCECRRRCGTALRAGGAPKRAVPMLEEACAEARKLGDRRLEAACLAMAALTEIDTGHLAAAEKTSLAALALVPENDSIRILLLTNLSGVYRVTARHAESERVCLEALAGHRARGFRRGEGVALGSLAIVKCESGRTEEGERLLQQALEVLRSVGDRGAEGTALGNLANIFMDSGRLEEAESTYARALALHREIGSRRLWSVVLSNLAILHQMRGHADAARREYGEALEAHRETGNRQFEGIVLGSLASVQRDALEFAEAEATYKNAIAIHREVGNTRFEGCHLCDRALLFVTVRRRDAARADWLAGTAILRGLGETDRIEKTAAAIREECARAGWPFLEDASP